MAYKVGIISRMYRKAYKVIGAEPNPYTNKVYSYMRFKKIPFQNVPVRDHNL